MLYMISEIGNLTNLSRIEPNSSQQDLLQLEEHIKDFDNRLMLIRERMQQRKQKRFFINLFKNFFNR